MSRQQHASWRRVISHLRRLTMVALSTWFLAGVASWWPLQRSAVAEAPPAVVPLVIAYSHNDEQHPRPLVEALECGFCSIEADVFAHNGQLLVGHDRPHLRADKSLQSVYLDPLRQRIRQNGGRVYPGGPAVFLLIDLKTPPEATYRLLRKTLQEYADILSVVEDGKLTERAITVVLSGDEPRAELLAESKRYAMLDGRLSDLDSQEPVNRIPWISDNWDKAFTWKGEGPMPEDQREKLRRIASKVHASGRLLRFWATPDTPAMWRELLADGVDILNVDDVPGLRTFLLSEPSGHPASYRLKWNP